jgi:tetratricopeptide (TPR) repeat protein
MTPVFPRQLLRAAAALLAILLSACATQPEKAPANAAAPSPAPAPPAPPASKPFPTDTLYSLLVAEIAGSRQRFDIMLGNYQQQAQATQDADVAARGAQLARYLNQRDAALSLSQLWVQLAPNNPEARQALLAEWAAANEPLKAFPHAQYLLEQGGEAGLDLLAARTAQSTPNLVPQLLPLYQQLLQQHPKNTSLLLGTSYLLHQQQQDPQALALVEQALTDKPDDIGLLNQQTRLLLKLGRTADAQARIKRLLDLQPENTRLRLQYAKSLASQNLPAAEEQFALLLQQAPNDPDLNLAMALVKLEQGEGIGASPHLEKLLNTRNASTAHYYLGRIQAQQKNWPAAIEHLTAVQPGPDYLPAQQQLSNALRQAGRTPEALAQLDRASLIAPADQQLPFSLLKANLLADEGRFDDALALLAPLLAKQPNASELLYTRALIYSRHQQPQLAEADLRLLLSRQPNNAAALNALGYGLAERPDKLNEAETYIKEALRLAPDDPAIMDSLGWVYFKQGKRREALKWLEAAYRQLPDAEIGAHLGEVLWSLGKKSQAKTVWRECLSRQPGSPVVLDTLKRLNITLETL